MPLTLSHPAAVLPLRRLGLPMSALVIGSMTPDLPLFLGSYHNYSTSHSFTGVVTYDAATALLILAFWFVFARDALVDLAPDVIRNRLPARARLSLKQWLLAPVAVIIGGATHVSWDSFTHPRRWGSDHVEWLRAMYGPLHGYSWAQYASGVFGLVVVLVSIGRYLRAGPLADPLSARLGQRRLHAAAGPAVVVLAATIAVITAGIKAKESLHAMAFYGVVNAVIALVLGFAVVCVVWHIRVFSAALVRRTSKLR